MIKIEFTPEGRVSCRSYQNPGFLKKPEFFFL